VSVERIQPHAVEERRSCRRWEERLCRIEAGLSKTIDMSGVYSSGWLSVLPRRGVRCRLTLLDADPSDGTVLAVAFLRRSSSGRDQTVGQPSADQSCQAALVLTGPSGSQVQTRVVPLLCS